MSEQSQELKQVECKPAKDPLVRRLILAAMLLGFGIWCASDMNNYPYAPMDQDINKFASWAFNHIGAMLLPLLGLIPLVLAAIHARSRLVANQTSLGYLGKKQFNWNEITEIDATQFNSKGFLFVYRGKEKMVLDSYKYQGFRELVKVIEQNVPADRIKR